MPNTIAKISLSTKDAIKRKSAYSLPDRPSDQGMKPDDIKRAFWQPIVDVTYSALTEIDRVIDEINNILNGVYDAHIVNANNPHAVTKAQVGLGNCNNTADADKPLSTPQREVLNTHNSDTVAHADIRNSIVDGLALKVPITDIQDAFTSTAADKPLSAYRGKILYDSLQTTNDKTELAVKSISLNSLNGILTITKTNGATSTIDLPLEYMVKSGYYDSIKKNIVLELAGGTTIEIPAAALVNEYYGDNSTITMYTDTADGNKLKFKVSDTYKAAIASEIANERTNRQEEIARVEKSIITKQGTTVTVGGIAQNAIAFNDDPQTEIDGKLDKLKCQYSKEISSCDSGVLFIGSFPIYDSNITIDISSTTTETYNARLIIACQNYQISSAETYGDATNTTTQNIFIKPSSSSDVFVDVYFSTQLWSKNIIEIKGENVRGIPTHICEIIPSIPANATLHPTNTLGCKENRPIVLYDKNSSDANINWGYPNGIYGGVEVTGKDFTPYKYLIAYSTHNNGDVNFVTTINTINANANYTASSSSIINGASLHFQAYKMTNSSIIANRVGYYENVVANSFTNWQDRSITGEYHTVYYIYKIEGVLK